MESNDKMIRRISVIKLRDAILDVSHPLPGSGETLSLARCFQFHVSMRSSDAFLKALIQRKIRCFCSPGCVDWHDVHIHCADLNEWVSEVNPTTDGHFSIRESAAFLRIKEQVAYGLVSRGLIRSTSHPQSGRIVSRGALIAFQASYVALSEWVGSSHSLGNTAYAWAQAQGLQLVSGPRVDGGRQYFVRRPSS